MKRKIICATAAIILMTGCSSNGSSESDLSSEQTSASETTKASESTVSSPTTTPVSTTEAITSKTTVATTTTVTEATTAATEPEEKPNGIIPPALQTPRIEGNRLLFTIANVYSDGKYYTVDISGIKLDSTNVGGLDTTYVKGELYGDFRLDLKIEGEITDTLKINIPRDDRFLILESVMDGLSYGCEILSNMREYNDNSYPDLIQLDFHIINEHETPQYARFFAIFDGKIMEVPIYENGAEVSPYGTHIDMDGAGSMTQHIVASKPNGSYGVIQYHYVFRVSERRLYREQVRFYG